MSNAPRFPRGVEFPHEGFVQAAIEAHFAANGHSFSKNEFADLYCSNAETGETWHIEAKGVTSQIGLDFRTCLGQLIQGMKSESTKYGIAVPDTDAFRRQIAKLSPWVVARLRIHWLYVSSDGVIRIESPS